MESIRDMSHTPTRIFPFLRYEDAPAAFEWLADAFGFEKQMVVPGPKGTIAHGQLRYGGGVVMIGTAESDEMNMKTPAEAGGTTQGIYVHVDDVLAHHDPVHDHVDVMFVLLVEGGGFGDFVEFAVDLDPLEALLHQLREFLAVFGFGFDVAVLMSQVMLSS